MESQFDLRHPRQSAGVGGRGRSVPLVRSTERSKEPPVIGDERIELGKALEARATEIGETVNRQFADSLKGQALIAGRLGAELMGRWLVTGEAAPEKYLNRLSMQGEQAVLEDLVLTQVARAYMAWREVTVAVLTEEAQRLATSNDLLTLATNVVRFSCDESLVRIVGQFDDTRRSLQRRLDAEQATLAHRALHDQLTGLPNRALLTDRLRQSASVQRHRTNGAMLLYLDLDNFKAINDRFGHPAGDCLLVAVATRLTDLIRPSDTVARIGGDEFVVLMDDVSDPGAAAQSLAERIHLSMQAPVGVGERELHTSVSIGIAPVPPGADPEACLARADAAMYQAKRGGPARIESYNETIDEDQRHDSQSVHDLRRTRESQQVSLHG